MNYTHFADDAEKMADFVVLTKKEFLESYSYLTETEYDLTTEELYRRRIEAYYHNNGYPNPTEIDIEYFLYPTEREEQFKECINYNYELSEFDRWQYFEDMINTIIPFELFMKINNLLYLNDIEVLELVNNEH